MAPRTEIKKSKLLLAEGADALHFFIAACEAFGVDDVQVMDFGGIKDLTTYLARPRTPWGHALGSGLAIKHRCSLFLHRATYRRIMNSEKLGNFLHGIIASGISRNHRLTIVKTKNRVPEDSLTRSVVYINIPPYFEGDGVHQQPPLRLMTPGVEFLPGQE